jgi:hypothetical protein
MDDLTERLGAAGRAYTRTWRLHEQARTELAELVEDALRAGFPLAEIVKLTGLTPDLVRNLAEHAGLTVN